MVNGGTGIVDLLTSVLDERGTDHREDRLYEPLPPGDFFLSEHHCGLPSSMVPKFWLDHAVDFIENGYNELIITGSLGSFKSTWANMITLYKVYELFSYRSIHDYLNKPISSDIYSIYFNVTMTQSRRTGFGQLKSMFDMSRWFKEHYPRDSHIQSMIKFPDKKRFELFPGSGTQHAIGMSVYSFILDEGDFFKKNGSGFDENYEQVTNMYQELVDRRVSRFASHGMDKSFSILISSASYQSSFVSKRIEAAASDDKVKVVKAIQYEILPEKYSDEKFLVFVGDANSDPAMIESNQDLQLCLDKVGSGYKISPDAEVLDNYHNLPPGQKLSYVMPPVDLKKRYQDNLLNALRNFSGVYIAGEGKLFQSKTLLLNAYDEELLHPFVRESVVVSTGDDMEIKDYFIERYTKLHERPHAMHIDGSLSGDSTGMSLFRYDGEERNGNIIKRRYTQVFSLEIKPPPAPHQIKLSKLREFIMYLVNVEKFNIVKITFDQFNSADSIQLLTDEGLDVGRQSIDKSDEPYLTWMSLLMDGCVAHYKHGVLEKEAFAAIHDRRRKKVDHPKSSDKQNGVNINVLQSAVGALNNLVMLSQDSRSQMTGMSGARVGAYRNAEKDSLNRMLSHKGGVQVKDIKKTMKGLRRKRVISNLTNTLYNS